MITNMFLLLERPHDLGGVQRIYRWPNGYGLSVVNAPMLHSYPFAWEIAVLSDLDEKANSFVLNYDTELTKDVEVFDTDDEANAFIKRAATVLPNL